jgi:peptidyl-prolyl cis-trans isomerase B (cyclophilin B)
MRTSLLATFLATAVLALALAATAQTTATPATPKMIPPTKAEIAEVQKQGRYLAKITLANGAVVEIVLEGQLAPLTVANFRKLANEGFYDDLTFHRVVDMADFQVVQGGDPLGTGMGGPGYSINLEIAPTLSNKKRAVAMARSSAPNSAGSQFYIDLCDIPNLDGSYAVFGWVKSDLTTVDNIKQGDKMKSVTVDVYTGTEPCPIAVEPTKVDAPAPATPAP